MIAGLLLANGAQAQQDRGEPADSADARVTTLGEVRALKPEDDVPVDLYRFKSPVQPEPNAFNRVWHEPPSLEEVGMRGAAGPRPAPAAGARWRTGSGPGRESGYAAPGRFLRCRS